MECFVNSKEITMKLGVLVSFEKNIENEIKKVHDMGFESCQISSWK